MSKLFSAVTQAFRVTDGESLDAVLSSACIGLALYPRHAATAKRVMHAADSALTKIRSQGAGSYAFYTADFTRQTQRYLQVEKDLQKAIERQEFQLHYQPQVDARRYAVVGAEALVRWAHPEHGLLAAGSFIDVAEQSGLITRISRQVLAPP